MKAAPRIVLVAVVAVWLTACQSSSSVQGIGTGTDDYKASPCACDFRPLPKVPPEALLFPRQRA